MKILSVILISLLGVFYFFRARLFLDPDFGWSIRLGELISKNGIPTKDPFSYTMPSYAFVDHEWLTHVIMFKLYFLFEYQFLAFVFTALAVFALFISLLKTEKKFMPLLMLFAGSSLYSFFGIRPQVVSWLLFAIVLQLIQEQYWIKYKYVLPLIFLIWANLHGGVMSGIIVLIFIFFNKKELKDRNIIAFSVLVTLFNPYGLRLWQEILRSVSDAYLRLYVVEWRPIFFGISPVTLIFLAFSLAFVIHYRNLYKKQEKVLFVLFFLAAFTSVRNLPFFIFLAVFLLDKAIVRFINEVGSSPKKLYRLSLFFNLIFFIAFSLSAYQFVVEHKAIKSQKAELYYPEKASKFLAKHLPEGQILSVYEWGGYLIWKLPQKKVFIDGRMPSWQQGNSKLESQNAQKEYNDLLQLRLPAAQIFARYNIDTILLPKFWQEAKDEKTSDTAYKFIAVLAKNNFKKIYQDNAAVIYSKRTRSSTADN